MHAAAILGPGKVQKYLEQFQQTGHAEWTVNLPGELHQADAVLLFGGDGTIHRHLPALVKLQLPVLVVPCGSGNDFARALGLRKIGDSLAAWRKFARERSNWRSIDLGVITQADPRGLKPLDRTPSSGTAEAVPSPVLRQGEPVPDTSEVPSVPRYFCCV